MEQAIQPFLYTVGGPLHRDDPLYVERSTDAALLERLRRRRFCFITGPHQVGKSSLMVHTAQKLRQEGVCPILVDLGGIVDAHITLESLLLGVLIRVAEQLDPPLDVEASLRWWREQEPLDMPSRLRRFLSEALLRDGSRQAVLFLDGVNALLGLPEDYKAAVVELVRASHRADRGGAEGPLTFVLLGTVDPGAFLGASAHQALSEEGAIISLVDFTPAEAELFACGLAPDRQVAISLRKRIYAFVQGHPSLTQLLCRRVAEWAASHWNRADAADIVDRLVDAEEWQANPLLYHTGQRLLGEPGAWALLQCYRRILQREVVQPREDPALTFHLLLLGLARKVVVLDEQHALLGVRNPLFARVFSLAWTEEVQKQLAGGEKPR